jgi:hypothetical protein
VVPGLVISAFDNPQARHDVQRLWSPTTIDLAAEELTAQVIVKNLRDDGICFLEAYTVPDGEPDEFAWLVAATGLAPERVADFESQITEADIAVAPADKRAVLEDARRRGQPICGRVGDLDLREEGDSPDFTPAVPFVTAFTGIVAAARRSGSSTRAALVAALPVQLPLLPLPQAGDEVRCNLRVQGARRRLGNPAPPGETSLRAICGRALSVWLRR